MKIQMRPTADMLERNLASSLYDVDQALFELIKNGLVACMPDNVWNPDPKKVRIEIDLLDTHPLTSGQTLVVLDHGKGMDREALERYFGWLGTPAHIVKKNPHGTHGGTAQKGIGRLAPFALIDRRSEKFYYVLSRTEESGPIRCVKVFSRAVEEGGIEVDEFVDPWSPEAEFLKEIEGSFTAILIPSPVLETRDEIYEAVKWHLPREQNKMFRLEICGKLVRPPPLEDTVNLSSPDGRFRARIGLGDAEDGGAWLCDAETGFRVASCLKLPGIPYPLMSPDVSGDIFAPGLLRHQDTGRSTLSPSYATKENPEWREILMFLVRNVCPEAKALLGEDEPKGDMERNVSDIVSLFRKAWGDPGDPLPGGGVFVKPAIGTTKTDGDTGTPPTGKPQEPKVKKPGAAKCESIRIRNEVWRLSYGVLGPHTFAMPKPGVHDMILINVRGGYKALSKNRHAAFEHCLMQILFAVGLAKFKWVANTAVQFANEIRAELLAGK